MQLSLPKVQEKRSIFILHIFSIDAPISDNNHFSESAVAARQKKIQVQPRHKNNISVKPIVYSFFTHIEY